MYKKMLPIPNRAGWRYAEDAYVYEEFVEDHERFGGGSIGIHYLIVKEIVENGMRITKPKDSVIAEKYGYNAVDFYNTEPRNIRRIESAGKKTAKPVVLNMKEIVESQKSKVKN